MDISALQPGSDPPHESSLERCVSVLETSVSSIGKTLAVMAEQMKHLATRDDIGALRTEVAIRSAKLETKPSTADLAVISGRLDTMASATKTAKLKGRVSQSPTVPVSASILVPISLLFAAGSWTVRLLPESWSRALQ